ncbi:MAG: PAS domain-containing protein, partial [Chloroflexi bacterium]|nr:PAS domain-containing protein [Chloroflexota bacterium]
PVMLFTMDRDGVFTLSEGKGLETLGLQPGQAVGQSALEMYAEFPEIAADVREVLRGRGQVTVRDVGDYVYETTFKPLFDDDGTPDGALGIVLDITDRVRAERKLRQLTTDLEQRVERRTAELAKANDELTKLDRLKTQFIADVSHEFRTPITSLNSRLWLLERASPEDVPRHVSLLKQQVELLKELIESVLNISRLELGGIERLTFAPLDINDLVWREMTVQVPIAEAQGLLMIFEPDSNLPPVRGDASQLAHVISNLLSNALRYTPAGQVLVSTACPNGTPHAKLEICDTGMGIPADELPQLFERFFRATNARQSEQPGTGLGLSIVKEIVDLHAGHVEVESTVGIGSIFRVYLPVWETSAEPVK